MIELYEMNERTKRLQILEQGIDKEKEKINYITISKSSRSIG
jgi:hypothetical protein